MQTAIKTVNLYDRDYCLWLETTAQLLKNRQLNDIDFEHLIEEIEAMGRSEKNALESNLMVILMHLLKYKYQPEKRSNSWKYTLREHRNRIKKAFKSSPSLKPYFETIFSDCYQEARKLAADETGLSLETFPKESPFAFEATLNPDYLPE